MSQDTEGTKDNKADKDNKDTKLTKDTDTKIIPDREAMYKLLSMYAHVKKGGDTDSIKCASDSIRLGGEINPFIEKHIEDAKTEITKFIQQISEPVQKRKYVRRNLNPELSHEAANTIRIYCEGSCISIGTNDAKASIGVFAHITTTTDVFTREVSQMIPVTDVQSNQRAELHALYEGIKLANILKDEFAGFDIQLVISSIYTYRCMTEWGAAWAKKDWKDLIHHRDIIRPAFETLKFPCKLIKKADGLAGFFRASSLASQARK
jgi:ribonuclease HI